MVVEIKERTKPLNYYTDSMLEVKKYNYLINTSEFSNLKKIYACIYPKSNTICVFNLSKIDINNVKKGIRKCNEATLISDNKQVKKRNKEVYYLPFNYGKKFEFDCSKYYN